MSTLSGFNNMTNKIKKYNIMYANCNCLRNKMNELRAIVSVRDPDLIFLNETWLNGTHDNALFNLNGYQMVVRLDGRDTREGVGRGLLIYAKSEFKCNPLSKQSS